MVLFLYNIFVDLVDLFLSRRQDNVSPMMDAYQQNVSFILDTRDTIWLQSEYLMAHFPKGIY